MRPACWIRLLTVAGATYNFRYDDSQRAAEASSFRLLADNPSMGDSELMPHTISLTLAYGPTEYLITLISDMQYFLQKTRGSGFATRLNERILLKGTISAACGLLTNLASKGFLKYLDPTLVPASFLAPFVKDVHDSVNQLLELESKHLKDVKEWYEVRPQERLTAILSAADSRLGALQQSDEANILQETHDAFQRIAVDLLLFLVWSKVAGTFTGLDSDKQEMHDAAEGKKLARRYAEMVKEVLPPSMSLAEDSEISAKLWYNNAATMLTQLGQSNTELFRALYDSATRLAGTIK